MFKKAQAATEYLIILAVVIIIALIALFMPWWVRHSYGDIMGAASLIGSMLLLGIIVLFLNINRSL